MIVAHNLEDDATFYDVVKQPRFMFRSLLGLHTLVGWPHAETMSATCSDGARNRRNSDGTVRSSRCQPPPSDPGFALASASR